MRRSHIAGRIVRRHKLLEVVQVFVILRKDREQTSCTAGLAWRPTGRLLADEQGDQPAALRDSNPLAWPEPTDHFAQSRLGLVDCDRVHASDSNGAGIVACFHLTGRGDPDLNR